MNGTVTTIEAKSGTLFLASVLMEKSNAILHDVDHDQTFGWKCAIGMHVLLRSRRCVRKPMEKEGNRDEQGPENKYKRLGEDQRRERFRGVVVYRSSLRARLREAAESSTHATLKWETWVLSLAVLQTCCASR